MRIIAGRSNLTLQSGSAKRGRDVYSAFAFFGTIGDVLAVGRPVRLPVLARTFCDLDRIAAADLLNPDIVLSAPVRAVGDEASVRRPGGSRLQALVKREACQ